MIVGNFIDKLGISTKLLVCLFRKTGTVITPLGCKNWIGILDGFIIMTIEVEGTKEDLL
jgi:hypothetical protein